MKNKTNRSQVSKTSAARRKKTGRQKKGRPVNIPMCIFAVFVLTLALFLGGKICLRSANSALSAANHELNANIQSASSAISVLETEITQLQEKSRVLGMLEGQVSENQENIYYYNSN